MGLPDGQTIDTDGNLWVAVFNGGCVIKIDPRKPETLLETIVLPAKQVQRFVLIWILIIFYFNFSPHL